MRTPERETAWRERRQCVRGAVISARGDLGPVLKIDISLDREQLISAPKPSPGFRGGDHQLEHHHLGGGCRERTLGPHGAVLDGSEHVPNRFRGAQVISILGGKFEERPQRFLVHHWICRAARVSPDQRTAPASIASVAAVEPRVKGLEALCLLRVLSRLSTRSQN